LSVEILGNRFLGYRHMAAIKTDGTLWIGVLIWWKTWNKGNQETEVLQSQTFAGGNNWKQVSCGIISHNSN
jgi:hypothetical protein